MSSPYESHFVSSANAGVVQQLSRIADALEKLLFTENEKDLQVFLFLDEDKQRDIATLLGLPSSTPFEGFLNEHLQNLPSSGKTLDIFKVMIGATGRWRANGDLLSLPPALPLLLLFSNAARAMGEGEDIAGHNYYEHLEHRLNTGDKPRLEQAYREHSVELWESYRDWLAAWQDEVGICTVVFPDDSDNNNRKFVQMAISQAILRSQERDNLGKMFEIFNLDSSVPISDTLMRAIIEEWLTRSQCSPRLKKMWKKKETHQSIIVGATAHLAQWTRDESGPLRDRIAIGISAQRVPRTGEVSLNLDILAKYAPRDPKFEVLDENENWTTLPVFEVDSRRFRVGGTQSFQLDSLLQEVIEGRLTSKGHTATGSRKPRAIVPLLLQNATREYTESPTIFLNSPFALLIRTEKEERLLPRVLDILTQCALPGWKVLPVEQRKNLPGNWQFIEGIQLVRPPSQELLSGLPALGIFDVVATSLICAIGGLRIPGRIPRWLASNPPTLVGSFPDEEIAEVIVVEQASDSAEVSIRTKVADGAATLDLTNWNMRPGVYTVLSITTDGKPKVRETLLLVSSDSPDVTTTLSPRPLASAVGTQQMDGFRSASPLSDVQSVPHVRGLEIHNVSSESTLTKSSVPRSLPTRLSAPSDSSTGVKIKLAKRSVPACAEGGAHLWILEKQLPNRKKDVYLGECKYCKFIFGFRTKSKPKQLPNIVGSAASKPQEQRSAGTPIVDVSFDNREEDWNTAFDALCFLQQGDYKTLTTICSQVSPSQLSITEFWKNLITLGHLEMAFDNNQRAMRWSVTNPTLSILSDYRGVLAGRRSNSSRKQLVELLESAGYQLSVTPCPGFIDYWFVEPAESSESLNLKPLAKLLQETHDGFRVESNFAVRALANLAPLSVVRNGLTSIKMFGTDRKWWHHRSRKWLSAENDWTKQGSYQTLSFTTSYFFNTTNLPPDGTSLLASYDLVKHLSAQLESEPLCAYDSSTAILSVPLGADLPRLYARAICGASGLLPKKTTNSELHYTNVSATLAEHLYWLLSH